MGVSQGLLPVKYFVAEVKALEPPKCLQSVVGGIQGLLPVKYFHSNKAPFVSVAFIPWNSIDTKDEANLVTLHFGDVTGIKAVLSVQLVSDVRWILNQLQVSYPHAD